MTGAELNTYRINVLKLSARQFALVAGTSEGSNVRAWERRAKIPAYVDSLIYVLASLSHATRKRILTALLERNENGRQAEDR